MVAHDEHLRIQTVKVNNSAGYETDEASNLGLVTQERSVASTDKSKLSPRIGNVSLIFDTTRGGIINETESFAYYCFDAKILVQGSRGWYVLDEAQREINPAKPYSKYLVENYSKQFRYKEFPEMLKSDRVLYLILRISLAETIMSQFSLQNLIMAEYHAEMVAELISLEPTAYIRMIETEEVVVAEEVQEEVVE